MMGGLQHIDYDGGKARAFVHSLPPMQKEYVSVLFFSDRWIFAMESHAVYTVHTRRAERAAINLANFQLPETGFATTANRSFSNSTGDPVGIPAKRSHIKFVAFSVLLSADGSRNINPESASAAYQQTCGFMLPRLRTQPSVGSSSWLGRRPRCAGRMGKGLVWGCLGFRV